MKALLAVLGEILVKSRSVSRIFLNFWIISYFLSVDFEQPRALWTKVWNDAAREAYVQNVAAHFGGVKSSAIKARQCKSLSNGLCRCQY